VIVNPLPKFKVTSPQIVCLSGPPLTLFIENPDAVYDYVWTAPNGDESFGEEITIESGGVYTGNRLLLPMGQTVLELERY
jgi:hypothetical protein